MSETEQQRDARKLCEQARELEAQRDYVGARRRYEQSLALYEDEQVRKALLKLLATLGPL